METRDLIQIQNIEYQNSLEADRKKEKEKLEAQKLKEEEELKEMEKRINIEENIKSKKKKLLKKKGGKEIKIRFQLPDKTIDKTFTENNTFIDLYDYIYTLDLGENFQIHSINPKNKLKKNNKTLEQNGILNRTKLYVYFDN